MKVDGRLTRSGSSGVTGQQEGAAQRVLDRKHDEKSNECGVVGGENVK